MPKMRLFINIGIEKILQDLETRAKQCGHISIFHPHEGMAIRVNSEEMDYFEYDVQKETC